MPTYEHRCKLCNYEWEDVYSIKADPPKICPECNQEGAERLISLTASGVVKLSGKDLIGKINSDARALSKESNKNENLRANIIGEDKFNNIVK